MTEEDYKKRLEAAIKGVTQLRVALINEERRSLVDPYDTGAGRSTHNFIANDLARQNGATSKFYRPRINQLNVIIRTISSIKNNDDLWAWFVKELADLMLNRETDYLDDRKDVVSWLKVRQKYQKENGSGVDWNKVHKYQPPEWKTGSLFFDKVGALEAIYHHFWV